MMDELTLERINLLPRAQAISAGDSVFTKEQRQFIAEIYKSLLGKEIPNCSCRNRFTDALIEICTTFKIKLNMSRCRYQLFAGVIIWIGTDCYSNHNLTDEVAEKYLAMHPEAREKEFQAWPDPEPEPEPVDPDNDPMDDEGDGEGEGEGNGTHDPDPEPEPEPKPKTPAKKKGK